MNIFKILKINIRTKIPISFKIIKIQIININIYVIFFYSNQKILLPNF